MLAEYSWTWLIDSAYLLEKSIPSLKIVILSTYFCFEISYAVRELEEMKKLRKFMRIKSILSENEVYSIMSSFDSDQFIKNHEMKTLCLKTVLFSILWINTHLDYAQ